jgi:phosphatidylserine/phosphatidylglycerophosphate/cardiolipin synthase-like enzyme
MLSMCRAFLTAKQYILLVGWDIRADLLMVRGEDAHAGAANSPEQRAYEADLRAAGLDDAAIQFWTTQPLTVKEVLGFAVRRGVKVGVLLWDAFHFGSHLTNNPDVERKMLQAVGVDCLLDDSSRKITHMSQSLHQKCAVVDGRIAFVGGIDLTMQAAGDYDRWDTHHHLCASPERSPDRGAPAHPWHDVHTFLEGPVVVDVLHNIVQRWSEVARRHQAPDWPTQLALTPPPVVTEGGPVQVVRTIPPHTYDFAPEGIATIQEAYITAIGQAERFIYMENQYLWPEAFIGLDHLRWGERSPDSMAVLEALGAALDRGAHVTLLLPDHPNCGRRFTDGGIAWMVQRAKQAELEGRLAVFTLGSSEAAAEVPGGVRYRSIYVHAKVMIVDDTWWTAGSANINSRGMRTDAEINVAALSAATAKGLRLGLWAEHLQLADIHHTHLVDPLVGLTMLRESAQANLARIEQRAHLSGHLLPYLVAGAERGQPSVDPEHGWLDMLAGGAGAHPQHYANRYL